MLSQNATSNVVRNNLAFANGSADYVPNYGTKVGFTLGTNLASANPLYVNYAGKNFHLQAGSPALGKSDPAYTPPTDITGAPRPSTPALGATARWPPSSTRSPGVPRSIRPCPAIRSGPSSDRPPRTAPPRAWSLTGRTLEATEIQACSSQSSPTNVVRNNLTFANGRTNYVADYGSLVPHARNDLPNADPLFQNYAGKDFRVRPGAPRPRCSRSPIHTPRTTRTEQLVRQLPRAAPSNRL